MRLESATFTVDDPRFSTVQVIGPSLECPEQLWLARGDAKLLDVAVEESLRLEPAAAVIDRYATIDVDLGGAPIRRGELVRVSISAANRDPAVFRNPEALDLNGANGRRHLAFAHGPTLHVLWT